MTSSPSTPSSTTSTDLLIYTLLFLSIVQLNMIITGNHSYFLPFLRDGNLLFSSCSGCGYFSHSTCFPSSIAWSSSSSNLKYRKSFFAPFSLPSLPSFFGPAFGSALPLASTWVYFSLLRTLLRLRSSLPFFSVSKRLKEGVCLMKSSGLSGGGLSWGVS